MPYKKSEKKFQVFIKRIFDIILSILFLILLSPLFIILAILIVKEDGRPVFFKQKRSGKNDVPFGMYKFRSMKVNQELRGQKKAYNWLNGVPEDFIFKTSTEHNPNITKTGAFIRKYSLDELPQFLNVLKGQMSIIGPRPEIVEITNCYDEYQRNRLLVKPGITGFAQVNGRSEMNHGQKIEKDLYYVSHFSICLDVSIFLKTILQVFKGKGSV